MDGHVGLAPFNLKDGNYGTMNAYLTLRSLTIAPSTKQARAHEHKQTPMTPSRRDHSDEQDFEENFHVRISGLHTM